MFWFWSRFSRSPCSASPSRLKDQASSGGPSYSIPTKFAFRPFQILACLLRHSFPVHLLPGGAWLSVDIDL